MGNTWNVIKTMGVETYQGDYQNVEKEDEWAEDGIR